jgi:hypothetical protein
MLKTPPSHPNTIGWATAIDSQCVNCKWLDWAGIYQFRQNACTTFSAKFMTLLDTCVVELLLVVGKPSTPPPPDPRPGPGRLRVQTNVKPPPGFLQRSNFHNQKQCILTSERRPTTRSKPTTWTKTRNMIIFEGFSPGAHEPNSLIKMEIWSVFIAAARSDFHVVCSRQAVNRNPT